MLTDVVIGLQWGDEGLYDISDWFAYVDVWSHCLTILDKETRTVHFFMITDTD